MGRYAIGDIQGCHEPFMQLLRRVGFERTKDVLWLVGDLVNRGPRSLEVLRFLVAHDDCVRAVLGNHDVYALARMAGVTNVTPDDTLGELARAPDRDALMAWLAARPLMVEEDGHTMVHAGLLPAWDLATARAEARHAEAMLRADLVGLLGLYFHGKRPAWTPALVGAERAVAALSVFTRIRFVVDGVPVAGSGPPEAPPVARAVPWFVARAADTTVVFGHWASLGLWLERDVVALDSGCVWNGALTAVRLEDRAIFSVPNRRDGD